MEESVASLLLSLLLILFLFPARRNRLVLELKQGLLVLQTSQFPLQLISLFGSCLVLLVEVIVSRIGIVLLAFTCSTLQVL